VPRNLKVQRALGKGLDENALAAVQQWRFQPATKDGNPVAVFLTAEVSFRLR
jgi:TonB family protein